MAFEKAQQSGDLKDLKKIFKSNPKDIRVRRAYAKILSQTNEYTNVKKAVEILEKSTPKDQKLLEYINFEIGRLYYCMGEFDNAIEYLLPLIKGINNEYALMALGKTYVALSDFDEAKDYFNRSLITRNSVFPLWELGNIAAKEGNQKELLLAIRNILKINPNFFDERNFLLYYVEGIEDQLKMIKDCYCLRQMKSYNKDAALNHISTHKYNSVTKQAIFRENLDLEKLYNEVLPSLNKKTYLKSTPSDIYIIPYPFIGAAGEQFLKVITNLNTLEIITMYPVSIYDDVLSESVKRSNQNSFELIRTR